MPAENDMTAQHETKHGCDTTKAFFLAFLDKWHLTIVGKINFLPESI